MLCATQFQSPVTHLSGNTTDEEERETIIGKPAQEDDTETCSTITAVQSEGGEVGDQFQDDESVELIDEGAAHDSQRVLAHSQHSQLSFAKEKPQAIPQKRSTHRTVIPIVPFGSTTACCSPVLPVVSALWESLEDPSLSATVELGAAYAGHPLRVTYVYEVRRRNLPAPLQATRFALSRLQCEVRLHFCRAADDPESSYKWTSFDVTDCSSSNGTYCAAVPLLPLHRYSIRTKDVDDSIFLRFGDTHRLTIRISGCSKRRSEVVQENPKPSKGIDVGTQWSAPALPAVTNTSSTTTVPTSNGAAQSKARRTRQTRLKKAPHSSPPRAKKTSSSKKKRKVFIAEEMETFVSSQCARPRVTVVTTGMRVTNAQTGKLRRLNIIVNPEPSEFHRLTHLVIDGPLMRSIKLLSALPYAEHIVDRAWFNASLSASANGVDPNAFRYTEQRTRDSIEAVNDFSLNQLMQTPPEQRRALFSGGKFWIHPNTSPQEPPGNDIRSVIIASGGEVTCNLGEATVVVMPRLDPSSAMWRRMKGLEECEENCLFIVPDNLFRCILQQRRPNESSVRIPNRYTVGSAVRSSPAKRGLDGSMNKISPRSHLT